MAFKVVAEPQFTHTVKIRTPVDGGYLDESCKATYRVIPAEEADAFDISTAEGSTAFLQRVIARLDELVDAEKNPIEWSDHVRDQVFCLPYARVGLARGYFEGVSGAKKGN